MSPALVDSYGRNMEYLQLSVTGRCNLRCFYCLPKGSRNFVHDTVRRCPDLQEARQRPEQRHDLVPGVGCAAGRRAGALFPDTGKRRADRIYHSCFATFLRAVQSRVPHGGRGTSSAPGTRTQSRVAAATPRRAAEKVRRRTIVTALAHKPERHEFRSRTQKLVRFMSATAAE